MTQFIYLAFLDASREDSFLPRGDAAYFVFSLTWLAEMFALIIIAMYRISPWIARALRDEWEASRILRDKRRHVAALEWVSSMAIFVRAMVRGLDSGHLSSAVVIGAAFACVPFVIPRPRPREHA